MTAEQQARDLLDRMGVDDAQSYSAGELVELANLIAMSRRFKVDVAYMPVPRCETCSEWSHYDHHPEDIGYCDIIAARVKKTFGCVEWKERSDG